MCDRSSLAGRVKLWKCSNSVQALWLSVHGDVFGVHGPVLVGGVYIPPESIRVDVTELYQNLMLDLCDGMEQHAHVLLAGDMNAHLDDSCELSDEFEVLRAEFSELNSPRMVVGEGRLKLSGQLLYDVACMGPLILTTGRGRGDVGQPTCRMTTRTEHILMDPDLYRAVMVDGHAHISSLDAVVGSDHVPLQLTYTKPEQLHGLDMCHEEVIQQGWEHCNGFKLTWVEQLQQVYTANLQANTPLSAQLEQQLTIPAGTVGADIVQRITGASGVLQSLIVNAAMDAGMAQHVQQRWQASNQHSNIISPPPRPRPRGIKRPPWFDASCVAAKRELRRAFNSGQATHLYRQRLKEYKRLTRRAKRQHRKWHANYICDEAQSKGSQYLCHPGLSTPAQTNCCACSRDGNTPQSPFWPPPRCSSRSRTSSGSSSSACRSCECSTTAYCKQPQACHYMAG